MRSKLPFFLAFVVNAFVGCGTYEGTGSNTNWLRGCDSDADCGGLECVCGLCTKSCDDECSELSSATCVPKASSVTRGLCREEVPIDLCLRECTATKDCESGELCFEGACVPLGGEACPEGSSFTIERGSEKLWARQGMVFADALYEPVSFSPRPADYESPITQVLPSVNVTTDDGAPARCTVHWFTPKDEGAPLPGRSLTGADGVAKTTWVAGTKTNETLVAAIQREDGSIATREFHGESRAHDTEPYFPDESVRAPFVRPSTLNLRFEPLAPFDALIVDMLMETMPHHAFYGALSAEGLFVGLLNSSEFDGHSGKAPPEARRLTTTAWNTDEGDALLVWKRNEVECGSTADEGGGIQCTLDGAYDVPKEHRFRVAFRTLVEAAVPDEYAALGYSTEPCASTAGCTDFSVAYDGEPVVVFRYMRAVVWSNFGSFLEPYEAAEQTSCLETPRYAALFSGATELAGDVTPLDWATASPVYAPWHNEVCANYAATSESGRFRLESGGPRALGIPSVDPWVLRKD